MKKYLLYILFLYTSLLSAQNLTLGFGLDLQQVRISNQFGEMKILGGEGLPVGLHIYAAFNLLDKLSLLGRVGNNIDSDFTGWEYGITGKYKLYTPFYLSAGILQHDNEGDSGSNSWSTQEASIFMFHAGLGINLSSLVSIGFNYYKPTSKKVIGYTWSDNHSQKILRIYEYMFRLSFVFGWTL